MGKVTYFFDEAICGCHLEAHHPMKPQRLLLTQSLVLHYGLHRHLEIMKPRLADEQDLCQFHCEDYISFLKDVIPAEENPEILAHAMREYGLRTDCPLFPNHYMYCQSYSGASIGGAYLLNQGKSQTVINWSGGMHHAKKAEAAGFCYVNDIVLAILELLKHHQRVLYIDIDVHHGDGVEEAFLTTNRVLTLSFHKYGDDYYPNSGDLNSIGSGPGEYYSINVPLKDGMDDLMYVRLFKTLVGCVYHRYQPSVIVLQCGADSLHSDKIGVFNLSIYAHAECVRYIKALDCPLLVLGGGGYNLRNVSKCWAYETAILATGRGLPEELPGTEFLEMYAPSYRLDVHAVEDVANTNSQIHVQRIQNKILERLANVSPVGVAFRERPVDPCRLTRVMELSTKLEDWLTSDEIAYLRTHVVMTDAQLTQLRSQIMSLTEINSRLKSFRKPSNKRWRTPIAIESPAKRTNQHKS